MSDTWMDESITATICEIIREDVRADIHFDLYGVERASEAILNALRPLFDRLTSDNKRMAELLRDCSYELESEVEGRYDGMLDHPSMKRRYDRDMETVVQAQSFLSEYNLRRLRVVLSSALTSKEGEDE